jgi:hypothetical protein
MIRSITAGFNDRSKSLEEEKPLIHMIEAIPFEWKLFPTGGFCAQWKKATVQGEANYTKP